MAKNKSTVYLGYDDEEITDKHVSFFNSTLNKIGGTPDWPNGELKVPACPLCGTARPLLLQLYAPLEMSQFHRTLYVFACLNPVCSQNSKSWLCVRTQLLDTPDHCDIMKAVASPKNSGSGKQKKKKEPKQATGKISWCSGIDDWGAKEEASSREAIEQMDTEADECHDQNEENGNVINSKNVNLPTLRQPHESDDGEYCPSSNADDEEDDSNSTDNDLLLSFNQMDVRSGQNIVEDPNANCADGLAVADVGGGIAAAAASVENEGNYACSGASAMICAEIEGAETDVVLVETPQKPERDLIALLKHTQTPAALGPLAKLSDLTIKPYFIAVELEGNAASKEYENYGGSLSSEHIRELYQEYKKQDESTLSPGSAGGAGVGGGGGVSGVGIGAVTPEDSEGYEKGLPAHGDLMFHYFLSTIQQNPGQILRYSRDTLPLLIAPLQDPIPKCPNCNGDTICEIQILSTLIPKLKMQQTNDCAPLEYGNVLVITCLKSCWDTPDKMRYEKVVVQAEK